MQKKGIKGILTERKRVRHNIKRIKREGKTLKPLNININAIYMFTTTNKHTYLKKRVAVKKKLYHRKP